MKKFLLLALLALCSAALELHALIIPVPNLEQFEKAVQESDERSLVLFDVDETLIIPKDRILRPCARPIFEKLADQTLRNPEIVPLGKYQKGYFTSQAFSQMEYELVDRKILGIIQDLQNRNIKSIAFTKMPIGTFGVISSMEDWRLEHLRRHSIDFSRAFPGFPLISLESNGKPSLFKQGLLCANRQDKGPVLIAFLEHLGWSPARVFLIDNRLDYLQTVEQSLSGTGIDFIGFHYTAAEDEQCIIDEKLAAFQLMHLAKTSIWLSDEKAPKKMGGVEIEAMR